MRIFGPESHFFEAIELKLAMNDHHYQVEKETSHMIDFYRPSAPSAAKRPRKTSAEGA